MWVGWGYGRATGWGYEMGYGYSLSSWGRHLNVGGMEVWDWGTGWGTGWRYGIGVWVGDRVLVELGQEAQEQQKQPEDLPPTPGIFRLLRA